MACKRCNKYIKRLGQRDKKRTRPDRTCIIVLFILFNFNEHDDTNDDEDDEEYDEANPALSACRSCGSDSLFRVAKTTGPTVRTLLQQSKTSYSPSFHVLFYFGSLSLDSIDGLILLLNQDTHLTF
jgi:hypothetical protein